MVTLRSTFLNSFISLHDQLIFFPRQTHPRRPRGRESSQEEVKTGKLTKTNERAPGILLLTDQFQKPLKSLSVIGQTYFCPLEMLVSDKNISVDGKGEQRFNRSAVHKGRQ